jgi:hypothetical protein
MEKHIGEYKGVVENSQALKNEIDGCDKNIKDLFSIHQTSNNQVQAIIQRLDRNDELILDNERIIKLSNLYTDESISDLKSKMLT